MISGEISADDYLEAMRLHRQPSVRRQRLILAAFIAIGLLIAWAGDFFPGITVFGAGAGGLIGEFFASKYLIPRKYLRIYNQQASFRSHYTYSWDTDRISVVSDTGQATRPWADYVKAKENERVFLLYHSDVMFEMFPKFWFQSPEQIDAFRRLAFRAGT